VLKGIVPYLVASTLLYTFWDRIFQTSKSGTNTAHFNLYATYIRTVLVNNSKQQMSLDKPVVSQLLKKFRIQIFLTVFAGVYHYYLFCAN
jgi:hypothetical protein